MQFKQTLRDRGSGLSFRGKSENEGTGPKGMEDEKGTSPPEKLGQTGTPEKLGGNNFSGGFGIEVCFLDAVDP